MTTVFLSFLCFFSAYFYSLAEFKGLVVVYFCEWALFKLCFFNKTLSGGFYIESWIFYTFVGSGPLFSGKTWCLYFDSLIVFFTNHSAFSPVIAKCQFFIIPVKLDIQKIFQINSRLFSYGCSFLLVQQNGTDVIIEVNEALLFLFSHCWQVWIWFSA